MIPLSHELSATAEAGCYPNYQHVIPREQAHAVTIPEEQRDAVCKWLRSQKGRAEGVSLSVDKPGHLTLNAAGAFPMTNRI